MVLPLEILLFIVFAAGWTAGRLAESIKLPGVLGMTLAGIGLAAGFNALNGSYPAGFAEIVPFLKSTALIIILLRAGLGISRRDLKKAGPAALLMALVPCLLEGSTLTFLFMAFWGWSLPLAGMAGFMLAAVSPAVVVPSMLELKEHGLGSDRGVVTTVLAGASADDVVAITFFTIFTGWATGDIGSSASSFFLLPASLGAGLVLGLILGFGFAWWYNRHHNSLRATEKALLLLAFAVAFARVGDALHIAALLGVMTIGFVLLEKTPKAASEIASKLGKVWVGAQIILFVLIGLALQPEAAFRSGPSAMGMIVLGLAARSLGVWLALLPTKMNAREKLFCVIAYWPKATVQAALGGVALSLGLPHGDEILALAVLAIVLTAPAGLLGIRYAAPRLLAQKSEKG